MKGGVSSMAMKEVGRNLARAENQAGGKKASKKKEPVMGGGKVKVPGYKHGGKVY